MAADDYPAIADHGLIGDQQTCALVSNEGTIDWFCSPRFDSPSIFASLLDHEKGGKFAITPHTTEYATKQLYFPDTAVLITRFMSAEGVAEIHDFMPIDQPWLPTDRHSIVRMVRVPRGEVTLKFEIAPRIRLRPRNAHGAEDRTRRPLRVRQGLAHAAHVGRARDA